MALNPTLYTQPRSTPTPGASATSDPTSTMLRLWIRWRGGVETSTLGCAVRGRSNEGSSASASASLSSAYARISAALATCGGAAALPAALLCERVRLGGDRRQLRLHRAARLRQHVRALLRAALGLQQRRDSRLQREHLPLPLAAPLLQHPRVAGRRLRRAARAVDVGLALAHRGLQVAVALLERLCATRSCRSKISRCCAARSAFNARTSAAAAAVFASDSCADERACFFSASPALSRTRSVRSECSCASAVFSCCANLALLASALARPALCCRKSCSSTCCEPRTRFFSRRRASSSSSFSWSVFSRRLPAASLLLMLLHSARHDASPRSSCDRRRRTRPPRAWREAEGRVLGAEGGHGVGSCVRRRQHFFCCDFGHTRSGAGALKKPARYSIRIPATSGIQLYQAGIQYRPGIRVYRPGIHKIRYSGIPENFTYHIW